MFRPPGHDRLSDYAHIDERFRYVELADRTLLVNSAHIVALTEVANRERRRRHVEDDGDRRPGRCASPVGSPARIMDAAGAPQDASSQPLTRQEILQLIGPIIPEHARRRLPQETSVEFDHASPSGAFKVTILRNGSEIAVSIVPDPGAARAGATAAGAGASAAAAPRCTPLHRRSRRTRCTRCTRCSRRVRRRAADRSPVPT